MGKPAFLNRFVCRTPHSDRQSNGSPAVAVVRGVTRQNLLVGVG